jgi:hypothetical protein
MVSFARGGSKKSGWQSPARYAMIGVMRKQYYFKPNGDAFDAWDVHRLIALSAALPVKDVALAAISDIDIVYWFGADGSSATVRILVRHMELVNAADLTYPVILGVEGQVMDGMHRIAKSLLLGRLMVRAVQFEEQPSPDYTSVRTDELPYD